MGTQLIKEDWDLLMKFFPKGWIEKAYESGALIRKRKIDSAQTLMRILLIHLADGKSLRTTAAYAKEANLCDLNDTALLKRLRASQGWLRWIAVELLKSLETHFQLDKFSKHFRIRLIDSTAISEPGSTGSDWRIHYAINLIGLQCDTFEVTDKHVGESLTIFPIEKGDLLLADRGYCNRKGISHVLHNGGDVLIRLNQISLPLRTHRGISFNILEKARKLKEGEVGDWDVYFQNLEGTLTKGRLCAIRKSKEAIQKAIKKLRGTASRKGKKLRPETLEFAEYVLIFTSVNRHKLKGPDVLFLYRGRWQIEIAFKRLKSIIGLGHLPKFDPESSKAWLYGKLVVTFLIEHIYREAEFFSPWGYPLEKNN
jgi:hypothetical protein